MALWLSQCNWTPPCSTPNSLTKHVSHKASLAASAAAMYSTSIVDMTTMDWAEDFQQIGPPAKVKTYHVVDFPSSVSPT